jgi:hypothetical protein
MIILLYRRVDFGRISSLLMLSPPHIGYDQLSRRAFLGTVGSGIFVGGLRADDAEERSTPDDVARLLEHFPEASAIPGIAEIRWQQVEGARKVFGVFPQLHWDVGLTGDLPRRINNCQRDLLHAMNTLRTIESARFQRLFNESTHCHAEEQYLDFYRNEFRHLTGGVIGSAPAIRIPDEMQKTLQDDRALEKLRSDGVSVLGYIGAAEILALRGKLQIAGAESPELRRLITRLQLLHALTKGPESEEVLKEYERVAYAMREDFLVSQIGASPKLVDYAVFGAAHVWEDDVDRYNEKHPDRKIVLVEIVTHAVAAWRKSLEQVNLGIAP